MSDWQQATLGQLFSADNSKLGAHTDEPPVMSLSKYDGFVRAHDYFDKRIASEKLDGYKTVEPGGWAYSTIHIDEGSIARNNLGETGVISPMYTTLRWRGEGVALSEYAELMVRSPRMLTEYANNAQGSVNRRRSLPFKAFCTIPITLPPLPVQKRIIEVIDSMDDQITALDREAEAATRVRGGLLDEFTGAAATAAKPLGELCPVIGSGPSWAAKDESSVPSEGAWTVLKITNTKPDGSIDLSELAYVVGLPARTKVIGPTSLVMIRTNGNRKRIGNVYLPPEEVQGAAVSAFQFILDATDAETRDYLYLALRSPGIQHQMSESASGSTGLGNLAVRWLKTLEIPWPDAEMREVQVESMQAIDTEIAAIRAEADRLRQARAGLLSSLLNRAIEVKPAELEA
jgi:type I restriction enzyme, S subunit